MGMPVTGGAWRQFDRRSNIEAACQGGLVELREQGAWEKGAQMERKGIIRFLAICALLFKLATR